MLSVKMMLQILSAIEFLVYYLWTYNVATKGSGDHAGGGESEDLKEDVEKDVNVFSWSAKNC